MQLLLTPHKAQTLIEACEATEHMGSAAIEIGVFEGGSLALIARHCPNRKIVGFDTFEGLPKSDWNKGELHSPGKFNCSIEQVALNLSLARRPNLKLVKGYFPDSFNPEDPSIPTFLSLAHVDVDFGDGILNCLQAIWPRLLPGGIIVVDDYDWPHTPQVKDAVESFLAGLNRAPRCHFGKSYQYLFVK